MQAPEGNAQEAAEAAIPPLTRLSEGKLVALRYRCQDVMRGITPKAIRAARAADLRAEALNSQRLQARFYSCIAEETIRHVVEHSCALLNADISRPCQQRVHDSCARMVGA